MLAELPKASYVKTGPAPFIKLPRSSGTGPVNEPPRTERSERAQTCRPHSQLCCQSWGSLADTARKSLRPPLVGTVSSDVIVVS